MRLNPTVMLAVITVCTFNGCLVLGILLPRSWPVWGMMIAAQFFALIASYIMGHDAAHRVASRRWWINELILHTSGTMFLFNGNLFRKIHLIHHAHTHEQDDPDRFAASHRMIGRIARSALLAPAYYQFAARRLWSEPKWRLRLLVAPMTPILIAAAFAWFGRIDVFLALWLTPLVLAESVMALMFSSLPHDYDHDQIRNLSLPAMMGWLLGNGHMHLAHHKFPRVRWYRLPQYWNQYQEVLAETARRRATMIAVATSNPIPPPT